MAKKYTSDLFVKNGGTSTQMLMADGSVLDKDHATLIETIVLGSSRSLILSDRNKNIENNNSITITVPLHEDVQFPIGTQIFFTKKEETINFVASGVVTINSVDDLNELGRINCGASLLKIGEDEWNLIGELV